jgi:hypothetical protein
MTCIKTGCQIYLTQLGIWAYGDAHQCGDAYFFRLVEEYALPRQGALHFEIGNYDTWWDRHRDVSTLIANASDCVAHGYTGTPIDPLTLIPEIWK